MWLKGKAPGLLLALLLAVPVGAFFPTPGLRYRVLTSRREFKARHVPVSATTLEPPSVRNSTLPLDNSITMTATLLEDTEPAIVDTPLASHHHFELDPVRQLREGGSIPAFQWPQTAGEPAALLKTVDQQALHEARSTRLTHVAAIWDVLAEHCGPNTVLVDPSSGTAKKPLALTFEQMRQVVLQAAAGLHALGLRKGDHISLFSENSAKWLVIEQGCAKNGLATAVRGATAPLDELQYIYGHSDSKAVILQDAALLKKLHAAGWLRSDFGAPRHVVLIKSDSQEAASLTKEYGLPILALEEVLALGSNHLASYTPPALGLSDLHTLVYTSGTTGRPKGVMLSNGNLVHQMQEITLDGTGRMNPAPGDIVLSLLPCWHIFERSAELFALSRGASVVYSSIRNFKSDLQTYTPQFLMVVPRLLESVHKSIKDKFALQPVKKQKLVAVLSAICVLYTKCLRRAKGLIVRRPRFKHNPLARVVSVILSVVLWPVAVLADLLVWKKVRMALGGKAKLVVSGGSALPKFLEDFYQAAGIRVVSGYGLTETAPVIAVRRADKNVVDGGVVGKPPGRVELRVVDTETGKERKAGRSGVVLTRGPQVMLGYYKDEAATAKAINADGWFDTGDLGFINPVSGDLVLTGRAKDMIVLSNGENVEPQPIEDAILEKCPLVDQVMLVGQDKKSIGALLVVNPQALVSSGLVSQAEGDRLADMVGPTAVMTGCKASPAELASEAVKLNRNQAVMQAALADLSSALQSTDEYEFREWERVKVARLLVEPFTIENGLVTQTLKVKRNVVADRYAAEIEAMYANEPK